MAKVTSQRTQRTLAELDARIAALHGRGIDGDAVVRTLWAYVLESRDAIANADQMQRVYVVGLVLEALERAAVPVGQEEQ